LEGTWNEGRSMGVFIMRSKIAGSQPPSPSGFPPVFAYMDLG